MSFGKKIAGVRTELALSQQDAAKKIGILPAALSRYERDEVVPSVEVAKKIASAYAVSLDFLVSENGKVSQIKDNKMLERLAQIERLKDEQRKIVLYTLDALLRDARTQQTYEA